MKTYEVCIKYEVKKVHEVKAKNKKQAEKIVKNFVGERLDTHSWETLEILNWQEYKSLIQFNYWMKQGK